MRQRITRRALVAAAVAAAITVTAAGCSSGAGSSSDSGPATISYAYWDTNMTKAYEAAAKKFHAENPDITVQLRQVPFDNYFTKLNAQVQSKSAPDVFWLQNIQFPLYAENGALADISSYVKGSKGALDDIPASMRDTFVVDGKTSALPWQAITFGLYYNKKLFKDAGVAEPTNDWTWDDVSAAAAKLTDKSKGTYGMLSPVWTYGSFYQTMYAAGAKVITKNGKDTDFDSAAAVKGIDFWADLSRKGYSPSVAQINDTSTDDWFQSGKVAMDSTGSWSAAIFAKTLGDDLGVVEEPSGDVDTSGAATTADAVSASSKHVAQAYKWAEFLSTGEGQQILNSTAGAAAGAPVDPSANDAWLKSTGVPAAKVFLSEIPKTTPLPASKNTAAWENDLTELLTPAWQGKETSQEAATKAAAMIRKALAAE